jgi:uncharacterized protein (DUF2344 family)
MRDDAVFQLATILYTDLPFWKRWKIQKYYRSNNWDVTDQWTQCVKVANKMLVDLKCLVEKYEEQK